MGVTERYEYSKVINFTKVQELAEQGWRLVATVPRLGGSGAEYVMERKVH